jgi:hypothetical protein
VWGELIKLGAGVAVAAAAIYFASTFWNRYRSEIQAWLVAQGLSKSEVHSVVVRIDKAVNSIRYRIRLLLNLQVSGQRTQKEEELTQAEIEKLLHNDPALYRQLMEGQTVEKDVTSLVLQS